MEIFRKIIPELCMNISNWIKHFNKSKTASLAKERLQIVIAHQRSPNRADLISKLRHELLAVISKYYTVDPQNITIELQRQGTCSILELNVALPETEPVTPL